MARIPHLVMLMGELHFYLHHNVLVIGHIKVIGKNSVRIHDIEVIGRAH